MSDSQKQWALEAARLQADYVLRTRANANRQLSNFDTFIECVQGLLPFCFDLRAQIIERFLLYACDDSNFGSQARAQIVNNQQRSLVAKVKLS